MILQVSSSTSVRKGSSGAFLGLVSKWGMVSRKRSMVIWWQCHDTKLMEKKLPFSTTGLKAMNHTIKEKATGTQQCSMI